MMAKHPALVAFAAAVSDLLALGPPDWDPDSPAAAADNATVAEVNERAAAVITAVEARELSEVEYAEASALLEAANEKLDTWVEVTRDRNARLLTFLRLPDGPLPRA
jgi:hypothetical protein